MPKIYIFSIEKIFFRGYFYEYPIRKERHTPRNLANKLQFQKSNLLEALENIVRQKKMVCSKKGHPKAPNDTKTHLETNFLVFRILGGPLFHKPGKW